MSRRVAAALVRAALAAPLVLAVGCAELPRTPESTSGDATAVATPFEAEGRLSARRGADGVSGQFTWLHEGTRDRIGLASPLGQTIAQLDGDGAGVRVEAADGRVTTAPAWDALSADALGFPLPVTGLAAWLRGLPRPGAPSTVERDAAGRPALLRQDGWEIVYAYADMTVPRASRLTLRYSGGEIVELRVVVDQWK